jgi:hypothetical protein
MMQRLTQELLRLCLHGTLRPERYPELDTKVAATGVDKRPHPDHK